MPRTHEVGRLFLHRHAYPNKKFPLVDRASTQEITYPFRRGTSVVVRFPLNRRGVVIGWWGQPMDEDEAMHRALSGELIGHKTAYDVGVSNGVVVSEAKASDGGSREGGGES